MKLDNSALAEFSCLRRAQLRLCFGIKGYESPEMLFGSAAHRAVECINKGKCNPHNAGPELFPLEGDELDHVSQIMRDVSQRYAIPELDRPRLRILVEQLVIGKDRWIPKPISDQYVEYKFSIPGDGGLTFCGTLDLIGIESGHLVVTDWKFTTSKYPADYLRDYKLKTQLYFYLYMLTQYRHLLPDEYRHLPMAARIRGVFASLSPLEIRDSEFAYLTPSIADEMHWILEDTERKYRYIRELTDGAILAPKNGMSTNACYRCPYARICANHDPNVEYTMVNDSPKAIYDPMKFR